MKEEIKEILEKLKDGNWYEELDLTGTMWIELRWEETHLLLDYITNLQEENRQTKLLKEKYQLEKEVYKQRNEKAIEYIKDKQELNKMFGTITLSKDSQNELLNILKGDKDE